MSAFLTSIKADLLDRRIAPLAIFVLVALVGAGAYVVLGGSSASTPGTSGVAPSVATATPGISVSPATTGKAVAETTNGISEQRQGSARNPFAPLPGTIKPEAAAKGPGASTASGAVSSTISPSSSSPSTTGSGTAVTNSAPAPSAPSKPAAPAKPQPVYHVAVLFGALPAEPSAESIQPTPYEDIKLFTPLPSAQLALVAYRGVTAKGKSATFTIVGEVILHGQASCLPSASQCQAIGLKAGQAEQLEYLQPSGQTVTYELRIVSISAASASTASVKHPFGDSSKAGRELLDREGLMTLPGLRYSTQAGALVLSGHAAFAAHAAAHR
jgi:hypothetical protein